MPDYSQHVAYRGDDGHIHELSLAPGGVWKHANLSAAYGGPKALSNMTGYVWLQHEHMISRHTAVRTIGSCVVWESRLAIGQAEQFTWQFQPITNNIIYANIGVSVKTQVGEQLMLDGIVREYCDFKDFNERVFMPFMRNAGNVPLVVRYSIDVASWRKKWKPANNMNPAGSRPSKWLFVVNSSDLTAWIDFYDSVDNSDPLGAKNGYQGRARIVLQCAHKTTKDFIYENISLPYSWRYDAKTVRVGVGINKKAYTNLSIDSNGVVKGRTHINNKSNPLDWNVSIIVDVYDQWGHPILPRGKRRHFEGSFTVGGYQSKDKDWSFELQSCENVGSVNVDHRT